jgi:CheY-like chemotaxis protein
MTALAMKGDRERCLAAGLDAYLAKPVTQTILAHVLAGLAGAAPASQAPAAPPAVDVTAIVARLGGQAGLLPRVVELFRGSWVRWRAALERGLSEGDAVAVARTAHDLAGAAGNLLAEPVLRAARRVEELARAGDLASARPVVQELIPAVERLQAALERARDEAAVAAERGGAGADPDSR